MRCAIRAGRRASTRGVGTAGTLGRRGIAMADVARERRTRRQSEVFIDECVTQGPPTVQQQQRNPGSATPPPRAQQVHFQPGGQTSVS